MAEQVERVSLTSIQHMLARVGSQAFLPTLEIDHHSFTEVLRFISDTIDLVDDDGVSYIAYPFDMRMPDDREDKIPTVNLSIGNVDRRIIPVLRSIEPPPPTVRMGIILRSDPSSPVVVPLEFEMTNLNYDAKTITATLSYQFRINAKFPKDSLNPATCPGIF